MNFYADIDRDSKFRKKYGAHFTPEAVVVEMCSTILNYMGDFDLDSFKFLDIASGTGVFSFHMCHLLAKRFNVSFKYVVENHCQMAELDEVFINKCKELYDKFDCVPPIFEGDALFHPELIDFSYSLVIGNPPYIRIQNLDDDYRHMLQKSYPSCSKGASDIYLAFIERSLDLLNDEGALTLITPSSYIRSEAGRIVREQLSPHLLEIVDFGSEKKFDCGTYTAVVYAKKGDTADEFKFNIGTTCVEYDKTLFIDKFLVGKKANTSLKQVCKIKGGIATLRDKIFMFKPDTTDDNYLYIDDFKIERGATKRFVKLSEAKTAEDVYASPYFCVYPYKDTDDGYIRYTEAEFEETFPEAFKYLFSYKEELLKRDKGKNKGYKWFEFGRTQGLTNTKECVVTSSMNNKPNFFKVDLDGFLFGSGLALFNITMNEEELMSALNSNEMKEYVYFNGAKYTGDWRGYNKRILEKFQFNS